MLSSDNAGLVLLFLILYLGLCAFATYYLLSKGEWKKVQVGLPLAFVIWIVLAVVTLPSIEKPLDSLVRSSIGVALLLILAVGIHPAFMYWWGASRRAIVLMGLAWAVLFGYPSVWISFSTLAMNNPVRIFLDNVWLFVASGLFVGSLVVAVHDAFKGISARKGRSAPPFTL